MSKITSKVIISILIMAVMAVSIYAWANVNEKISVNQIQVKPSTPQGLYISKSGSGSEFTVEVAAKTTSAATLSAVSTTDLINWYVPDNMADINGNGGYDSAYTKLTSDFSSYYYSESFKVKSSEVLLDLKVTEIVVKDKEGNAPSKDISKALRVGIKTNTSSGNVLIFAPVDGYDSNCMPVYESGKMSVMYAGNGSKVIKNSMQANTEYTIEIYVWYEGEDSNYTLNNLYSAEELTISISFSGTPNS